MSDLSPPQNMMVSVVVPVYCGADYLAALVAALDDLRREWQAQGAPFTLAEAIFVEDAAIDDSGARIDQLPAIWERLIAAGFE